MKPPFSPEILDAMPERMAELFRSLEITLLEEIAKRLKAAGKLNEVTVSDIRALRSHGIRLNEVTEAIRAVTGKSKKEIKELFDDVVARNKAYYSELVSIFKEFDANNNAVMEKNEFVNLLKELGYGDMKKKDIDALFKDIDLNKDNVISFYEYLLIMKKIKS